MSLPYIPFSPSQQRVANYFARNFGSGNGELHTGVSTDCQMFRYAFPDWNTNPHAAFNYFNTGVQQVHAVEMAIGSVGRRLDELDSVLDFASGFGRLTRQMIHRMDPAKLWVSDIQPESMAFQGPTFGVHSIVSGLEPSEFDPGRKFDLIFVASLFSHLPRNRFDQWLRRLWELLEPGGVLAFSVLDRSTGWMRLPYEADGFSFNPEISEIDCIENHEYGSTIVTEQFVAEAIARATDGRGHFEMVPRGLWHQDVYVLSDHPIEPPNWGLMDSYFPYSVTNQHVFGTVYGTKVREIVLKVEVLCKGSVFAVGEAQTWSEDAVVFHCGDRFLGPGWGHPVAFSLRLPRPVTYEDDIVVKAYGQWGAVRTFPVNLCEVG